MADALTYLTYLGIILLIGLVTTVISGKLKIPNVLLLLLIGIGIGKVHYGGSQLILVDDVFITGIGIIALVLIIFDSSSKLNLKSLDEPSAASLKCAGIFLALSLVVVGFFTKAMTGVSWGAAVLFSSLAAAASPAIAFAMMHEAVHGAKNRIIHALEAEAAFSTPLTILVFFIILDFVRSVKTELIAADFIGNFIGQIAPFLQQIAVGIGSGIVVGIVAFKLLHRWYSEKFSPLVLLSAALLAYILAENLSTAGLGTAVDSAGGNGIIAVAALGLFWSLSSVRQKQGFIPFFPLMSSAVEIIVFVLIGLVIDIPLSMTFLLLSLGLFGIYLLVRYLSVQLSFGREYGVKQKIFMVCNAPKGASVAVMALVMTTFTRMQGIEVITSLVLAFIIYSIILASVFAWFLPYLALAKAGTTHAGATRIKAAE